MKYDDYGWHAYGDYPEGLEPEAAMTHIGMFLGWVVDQGLEGDYLRAECAEEVARFRAREITGRQLLELCCDGKLTDEDMNDVGNAFAVAYYQDTEKGYYYDYECLCDEELDSLYEEPDTWGKFAQVSAVIGKRFAAWQKKNKRR